MLSRRPVAVALDGGAQHRTRLEIGGAAPAHSPHL